MADFAVIEATTGERCGNVKAPPVINFVKSLFVGASDTRTLERYTAVTAAVRARSPLCSLRNHAIANVRVAKTD